MENYRATIVLVVALIIIGTTNFYLWITGKDIPQRPYVAELFTPPTTNAIRGNAEAPITIVEFFDYNCPFSRSMEGQMQTFVNENPDVRIIYREYDVFGKKTTSNLAALAALASHRQQAYLRMHDLLLTKPKGQLTQANILYGATNLGLNTEQLVTDMGLPILQKAITHNRQLAENLQLNGTPAFVVGESALQKEPNSKKLHIFTQVGLLDRQKLTNWINFIRQQQKTSDQE